MPYEPQFTISPRLLSLVERTAALRERILGAALDVSRQGTMDLLRPLLEAGMVEKTAAKRPENIF